LQLTLQLIITLSGCYWVLKACNILKDIWL
jgi:hypothetical protein